MKKIVIANFKMNQTPSETKDYMIDLVARMKGEKTKVVVCPPFTSLAKAYSLTKKTNVLLGAQNFHYEEKGVYNEDGSLNLNPNSLTVLKECYLEPNFADAKAFDSFQFVRNGYFCVDCKDSTKEHLVFNRIVSLKSSFKM